MACKLSLWIEHRSDIKADWSEPPTSLAWITTVASWSVFWFHPCSLSMFNQAVRGMILKQISDQHSSSLINFSYDHDTQDKGHCCSLTDLAACFLSDLISSYFLNISYLFLLFYISSDQFLNTALYIFLINFKPSRLQYIHSTRTTAFVKFAFCRTPSSQSRWHMASLKPFSVWWKIDWVYLLLCGKSDRSLSSLSYH